MLDRCRFVYRGGCCLLLAALAACSTAPLHSGSGSGTPQPYARTENAPRSLPSGLPQFIDHSVGEEEISIEAMSLVGVPYRWGGNTPDSGFDCSGLVDYVVRRAAAVNLPRTTEQMESFGSSIEPDEISPGDLIFFNTTGRAHSHVGIYVGQYRFVNAPSTGGTVRIDYVTNPYWAKRFDGIRRVAAAHRQPFENAPLEAAVAPPPHPTTALGGTASPVSGVDQEGNPGGIPAAIPATSEAVTAVDGNAHELRVPLDASPADQPDDPDSAAQADPIARIANLSGAGVAAPPPPSTRAYANPAPALREPMPDSSVPSTGASQAADPIAGFANSSM